jgi:hypothetical protein
LKEREKVIKDEKEEVRSYCMKREGAGILNVKALDRTVWKTHLEEAYLLQNRLDHKR